MEPCKHCQGTGKINTAADDMKTGSRLKKIREGKKISLRKTAANMSKSPTYLSRLEHGRERWNDDLERAFMSAIGEG